MDTTRAWETTASWGVTSRFGHDKAHRDRGPSDARGWIRCDAPLNGSGTPTARTERGVVFEGYAQRTETEVVVGLPRGFSGRRNRVNGLGMALYPGGHTRT